MKYLQGTRKGNLKGIAEYFNYNYLGSEDEGYELAGSLAPVTAPPNIAKLEVASPASSSPAIDLQLEQGSATSEAETVSPHFLRPRPHIHLLLADRHHGGSLEQSACFLETL